jgi:hypothetical protein
MSLDVDILAWSLFWLLLEKLGNILFKSSGHTVAKVKTV